MLLRFALAAVLVPCKTLLISWSHVKYPGLPIERRF